MLEVEETEIKDMQKEILICLLSAFWVMKFILQAFLQGIGTRSLDYVK